MYFQIFQATNGNWYWHLKSANHEIVANGEGYSTKQGAEHAVALVKSSYNAPVY
ncbi:MAG TPA: YegP family protein [Chthoniobacterales bacterium]|jgi:hypothetical protein